MPHPPLPPAPSRAGAYAAARPLDPLTARHPPHAAEAAFDDFRLALHRKRKRQRADALVVDGCPAERKRPPPAAGDAPPERR